MFGAEIQVRFEVVKASRQKSGKCPVCGKRVVRKTTFEQTLSPYNKNGDGTVKNYHEVSVDVNKEANRWKPDFHHEKCL